MAFSLHLSGPRHLSTSVPLRPAGIRLVTPMQATRANPLKSLAQHPSHQASNSRSFWWGHNKYANRSASSYSKSWRYLEAQRRVIKYRSGKGLPSSIISWTRDSPLVSHPTWRLSSTWGKNFKDWKGTSEIPEGLKSEAEKKEQWKIEYQRRQDELAARFARLKKYIEEDPYHALFGKTLQRGVWNPFAPFDWPTPAKSNHHGDSGAQDSLNARYMAQGTSNKAQSSPEARTETPNKSPSDKPRSSGIVSQSSVTYSSEDYEIDPITMRKVPRIRSNYPRQTIEDRSASFSIPVKTCKPQDTSDRKTSGYSTLSQSTNDQENSLKNSTIPGSHSSPRSTLDQSRPSDDGSAAVNSVKQTSISAKFSPSEIQSAVPSPDRKQLRIESALERHCRSDNAAKSDTVTSDRPLIYPGKENTVEDIDLLRASDVRAGSGHAKRTVKESEEVKQERRKKLEEDFEKRPRNIEERYAEEIAASNEKYTTDFPTTSQNSVLPKKSLPSEIETPSVRTLRQITDEVIQRERISASLQDKLVAYRQKADSVPEEEVGQFAKTRAMLRDLVNWHEANLARIEGLRDEVREHNRRSRNSTPRASHQGESNVSLNEKLHTKTDLATSNDQKQDQKERLLKESRDKALVSEIKAIYEESYGPITSVVEQAIHESSQSQEIGEAQAQGPLPLDQDFPTLPVDVVQESNSEHTSTGPQTSSNGIPFHQQRVEGIENISKMPHLKDAVHRSSLCNPEAQQLLKSHETKKNPEASEPALKSSEPESSVVRDPSVAAPTKAEQQVYKILGLDNQTNVVSSATTRSSLYETSLPPRSASSILSHLANPGKFIPHIEALDGIGFELIAGSRNSLVYKKVGEAKDIQVIGKAAPQPDNTETIISDVSDSALSATAINNDTTGYEKPTGQEEVSELMTEEVQTLPQPLEPTPLSRATGSEATNTDDYPNVTQGDKESSTISRRLQTLNTRRLINPIDGTTGRFASPTGFVNHDSILDAEPETSPPPPPPYSRHLPWDLVHRQEPVFSGSPRSQWAAKEEAMSSSNFAVASSSSAAPAEGNTGSKLDGRDNGNINRHCRNFHNQRAKHGGKISKRRSLWRKVADFWAMLWLLGAFVYLTSWALEYYSDKKMREEIEAQKEREREGREERRRTGEKGDWWLRRE
ncbi:MAG: hypothetical protein MMC33_004433 [Icmadophila ericetorum]|nr:hypothetical protein [Icmadophila ericetorum]